MLDTACCFPVTVFGRLKSDRPFICGGWKLSTGESVTSAHASRRWPCPWNRQKPANSRHSWSSRPKPVPRGPVTCSQWPWCSVQHRRSKRNHPHCRSLRQRKKPKEKEESNGEEVLQAQTEAIMINEFLWNNFGMKIRNVIGLPPNSLIPKMQMIKRDKIQVRRSFNVQLCKTVSYTHVRNYSKRQTSLALKDRCFFFFSKCSSMLFLPIFFFRTE